MDLGLGTVSIEDTMRFDAQRKDTAAARAWAVVGDFTRLRLQAESDKVQQALAIFTAGENHLRLRKELEEKENLRIAASGLYNYATGKDIPDDIGKSGEVALWLSQTLLAQKKQQEMESFKFGLEQSQAREQNKYDLLSKALPYAEAYGLGKQLFMAKDPDAFSNIIAMNPTTTENLGKALVVNDALRLLDGKKAVEYSIPPEYQQFAPSKLSDNMELPQGGAALKEARDRRVRQMALLDEAFGKVLQSNTGLDPKAAQGAAEQVKRITRLRLFLQNANVDDLRINAQYVPSAGLETEAKANGVVVPMVAAGRKAHWWETKRMLVTARKIKARGGTLEDMAKDPEVQKYLNAGIVFRPEELEAVRKIFASN